MEAQTKDILDFENLKIAARRGNFSPIYIFYGNEEFLIEESIKIVTQNAIDIEMKDFNFNVVYGNEIDLQTLLSLLLSLPMMSKRRVVVLKNAEKLLNRISRTKKDNREIESFLNYLSNPNQTTIFILILERIDSEKEIYRILRRVATIVELKAPYDWQIPSWIAKRVRERGKLIEDDACKLLQTYVGNSLRDIDNELTKLFNFIGDEKTTIEVEDIKQVVGTSRVFSVFDLQKAIGEKNLKEAMSILERMLHIGEHPPVIITMLTRYFSTLWKLYEMRKTERNPKKLALSLQISQYHIREYLLQLDNYTEDQIKNAFKCLIEADELVKTTSIDPGVILGQMIYRIIKYG
jgi:DNA polymerase-3 subunit delta